jgi:Tfp pilus assembly protein PilE
MGSQQLLLILVGVIIVGIMIAVGLDMFKDQASSTNRDSIANDLANFAVQAQKYYRRPEAMRGGGYSFNGLRFADIAVNATNANGTYVLSPDPAAASDAFVIITGTGNNKGNDGATSVQVQVTVWPESTYIETLN